ncbi:UDP-N-acetylmuramoyl-tripeptide--D-alanyl-D-alanine ligase [Chitinolyticbacter meiyuanensis]|uniref:UDP-N-acetylmuramoyl-tripeptide--D-alanyl-D- alanine ligase n=1 Tax=Chitinolyticbacter meiyuanensis TaxID=682798 RepID=UPI0011E5B690|nr:UDP-N-acetylmuramoyl-tripeptide--D-alanyl-D-alanine ligase [Chitinolyticbacter meiyuanensis]
MMLTLRETALALEANLVGNADLVFDRVTTDSRDVRPGDLFVALKGDRFDGHDYVAGALVAGAVAALVDHATGAANELVVADTLAALGRLGAYWRHKLDPTVIAITGSNGKTTVKEMTATVLRELAGSDAVLATQGNLNNHIGVPLTLLSLRAEHRYAVVEMGMNHFGEIDYLTHLAAPDVALVNNAASAHLEALGSVEGVAQAKGELFGGLSDGGIAIINADDEYAALWSQLAAGRKQITFGVNAAEVGAREIELGVEASRFILDLPLDDAPANLPVPGLHNVRNALAAAAVAYALGFAVSDIAHALGQYRGVKGRLQMKRATNGARVIDDSYNANPDSMKAAIDVLVASGGDTVLVLGDIGEVGANAAALHAEVGAYARARGVGKLFTLGEQMCHAAEAFGEGAEHHADNLTSLLTVLQNAATPQSTVLVKGSRFMKMERVVDALVEGN